MHKRQLYPHRLVFEIEIYFVWRSKRFVKWASEFAKSGYRICHV